MCQCVNRKCLPMYCLTSEVRSPTPRAQVLQLRVVHNVVWPTALMWRPYYWLLLLLSMKGMQQVSCFL